MRKYHTTDGVLLINGEKIDVKIETLEINFDHDKDFIPMAFNMGADSSETETSITAEMKVTPAGAALLKSLYDDAITERNKRKTRNGKRKKRSKTKKK